MLHHLSAIVIFLNDPTGAIIMKTIILSLEEAALDLASVVRSLLVSGDRAVLTDAGKHLVEIVPINSGNAPETPEIPSPRTGPRVVCDEITGYPVVTARPGARKITSEDVRRMLEGCSFPRSRMPY
jgi:hypothetical protein